MPRQPSGAGAAIRSPSGAAVRASALSPSSPPPPPQNHRALRARYNALLTTLYERTSLTQREIAAAAGHTVRSVQMLVRALGCIPRHAERCRPGTTIGVRRAGTRPPPLNAPAARRLLAAFEGVARELAAFTEAQAGGELRRATVRAQWRTVQAQKRVMASAMRELSHYAVVIENAASARDALAPGSQRKVKRSGASRRSRPPNWPSREEMFERQQRAIQAVQAATRRAHDTAQAAKAAAPTPAPMSEAETEGRRINAITERFHAAPQRGPRIRGL
jgi:hypothetical protein